MIALDWKDGTRTTLDLPLTLDGHALQWEGETVVLTLRWPDDPAIARVRNVYLAHEALLADALAATTPDALLIAARRTDRDESFLDYAAAVVLSWSVPVPVSVEGVRSLYARAPFALNLVVDALGDLDRFLPASLRSVPSTSQPALVEVA